MEPFHAHTRERENRYVFKIGSTREPLGVFTYRFVVFLLCGVESSSGTEPFHSKERDRERTGRIQIGST